LNIQELNDNLGLRGSSNQKVYYLTDRLKGYDFVNSIRKVEIVVQDSQALVIGVPPKDFPQKIKNILNMDNRQSQQGGIR
jgi:hypothetical protein